MPHASYLTGKRKETHFFLRPPLSALSATFPMQIFFFFTGHFPLERDDWLPCRLELHASGTTQMLLLGCWTILQAKAGPGSTLKDSRRSFKWVEMMCVRCRQSHVSPLTGCDGLTTLALIQGDTQPSNLLSAQFQWTMEFRARRYTTLLSALRLAARLMRLRLPTGEPNGVKTKVLLWTNNPSLPCHTERRWLLANTPALPLEVCSHKAQGFSKRVRRLRRRCLLRLLKCRWEYEVRIDGAFWTGMCCKSPKTLNDVQVDLLQWVPINLRLAWTPGRG